MMQYVQYGIGFSNKSGWYSTLYRPIKKFEHLSQNNNKFVIKGFQEAFEAGFDRKVSHNLHNYSKYLSSCD